MPAKIHPGDWDRLFAPNAPRRGGPLRALVNVLLTIIIITLLGVGGVFAINYRNNQIATQAATATAIAPTIAAIRTQTAEAKANATATYVTSRTATAIAKQPTPEPSLGAGIVVSGGNLRQEPPGGAVIGLIWPGDEVFYIQEQQVGGQTWFRIRLIKPASNRSGEGVAAGTVGWASGTLVSPPTPVVTPAP
ncbi:MAG: SH3 domain-containing protein [Roseiflexaceae bacterium]